MLEQSAVCRDDFQALNRFANVTIGPARCSKMLTKFCDMIAKWCLAMNRKSIEASLFAFTKSFAQQLLGNVSER